MDLGKLKASLEKHEDRRYVVYIDTEGHPTIGVGHNLDAKPLSDRAVDVILEDDIADALKLLDTMLPWAKSLDDVRYRVLAEMSFNMGSKLLQFKQTLASVKRGDYDLAASQMLQSKWASQVKGRAVTLATMMRTGKDPE